MEEKQITKTRIKKINIIKNEDVYDITVEKNHNFFANKLLIHNCGEQLLPTGGVCLLGSINLTQFVNKERTNWDYKKLEKTISYAVRLMDNVNDITYVPLPEQAENLKNKRRIGLGTLGYGSALMMMKHRYGSTQALKLTEELQSFIANIAYQVSALLAKEKGAFPLYDEEKYLSGNFVKNLSPETIARIKQYGLRNSHLLSIQPTGNTSIVANNVSGGLEPLFMPVYTRTSILPYAPEGLEVPINIGWANKTFELKNNTAGEWVWIKEGDENLLTTTFEGEVYKIDQSRGLLRETTIKDYSVKELEKTGEWDPNADWAATTTQLNVDEHINTMAIFAKYVDSAISKTVNLPSTYSYDDFKSLYMKMYDSQVIKGGTTYRAGTMTEVLGTGTTNTTPETERIIRTTAPKRPKELNCDIHQLMADGEKWLVIVGLLESEPYEVFAFKTKTINLSNKLKQGKLIKEKKGRYNLDIDGFVIENLSENFESAEEEALTRMISTSLRHGADIEFIVDQLAKSHGIITSFTKAVGRILKKYIKETKLVKTCDSCGSINVSLQEGCFICLDCGSSKCS